MKADMEILDAGLAAAEKLYLSLRTFKQIVGEIVSLDDEAQRAKADAATAQKSLADLQFKVTVAQTELDKLNSERDAAKHQISELAAQHTQLTNAITEIRNKLRAA